MSQHTPGPWWAVNGVVLCGDKNDPEIICAPSADIMAVRTEDDEANARLIAEAPAMLDLLKRYVEGKCPDDGSTVVAVKDHACFRGRALLARIEGKEATR